MLGRFLGDSKFPHSKHLGEEMFSLGWLPLTGLPWNLPAVPGICSGPSPTLDGTSYQAHQLVMSFNVLKLILSQCLQRSPVSVGWPQGLALPCACIWAVVARIAVVCCADLCGSLPWTDHCLGHCLGNLVPQFSLVDRCFGRLFCQFCSQPFPYLLGSGSWWVSGQV